VSFTHSNRFSATTDIFWIHFLYMLYKISLKSELITSCGRKFLLWEKNFFSTYNYNYIVIIIMIITITMLVIITTRIVLSTNIFKLATENNYNCNYYYHKKIITIYNHFLRSYKINNWSQKWLTYIVITNITAVIIIIAIMYFIQS